MPGETPAPPPQGGNKMPVWDEAKEARLDALEALVGDLKPRVEEHEGFVVQAKAMIPQLKASPIGGMLESLIPPGFFGAPKPPAIPGKK